MNELINVASWVLLALMWGWVLPHLFTRSARARAMTGGAAQPPQPGGEAGPAPQPAPGPARPVVVLDHAASQPSEAPLPAPRSTARSGVLLLGNRPEDLAVAHDAATRHLDWLTREGTATSTASHRGDSDNAAVALATARIAVLGTSRSADTNAALRDCATVGVPLLLPARR